MDKISAYTDGSSTVYKDGRNMKYGGIGVHFVGHDRDISEGFQGEDVTNQRMELLACIKCIETYSEYFDKQKLTIYTDSMNSINCATVWGSKWISLGWKRTTNEKIKNLDLIKQLYYLTTVYNVKYVHVRSHQKKPAETSDGYTVWYGNNRADYLANSAMLHNKNKK